jgi:NodT family efflux transporter outer membrane factor (OMF) lipoprotein
VKPLFVDVLANAGFRVFHAVVAAALVGCVTVGPDYVAPDPAAPSMWQAEPAAGMSATAEEPDELAHWWATLDDPVLTRLVDQAVAGNLDLKQARARLREARARRSQVRADRFPGVDANASVNRVQSSEETGPGVTTTLYSAGFDASWELDVFGGTRRAVEAATASEQASEEDLRDVLVSLLSEVALNYVELRTGQTGLAIAEQNRDAQQETYDIVRWRFEAGLGTELDVEQARYNLEQTKAQIPRLQAAISEAQNRLAVLLGRMPGALNSELAPPMPIPVASPSVAVGVPADMLRRRPDVRRAERRLAAQTAQIGVATAARYPRFSLLGTIGLESLSSANLFTAGARTSSLGASALWTMFDFGRLREEVNVQSALQEQALLAYESTVRTAVEDTENALVGFAKEQTRRSHLKAATEAAERAATLARERYESGLLDFQTVLDAQRSLLTLQDQLAISDGLVTSNLIQLYKALGGGWTSFVPSAGEPSGDPTGAAR